ncbi:gas vesicle protein, partial [Priestia megaterium]|uniref:gas vesicle protein n=1 Tax=Priestia megaterium TaxID=1404 RepID=UPI003709C3D0
MFHKPLVIPPHITLAIAHLELLTIKIPFILASVHKPKQIRIHCSQNHPYLTSKPPNTKPLQEQNKMLHHPLKTLQQKIET